MKLKINKACDLSSISVLPPHSRRTNVNSSGNDASVFGKSQGSQFRSQSQLSLSQGMPLSQLSQNSLDEIVVNDHRFGSQERENSLKRNSCLAPITYSREESLVPVSRSSNNVTRRWNSSSVSDHRCQVSEELEHRIGLVETSLNKLGMILDSVQSDVMQVNKSVKEVLLETEGIRQKIIAHDGLLQLMLKGEEDIKATLDGSLKSISDQSRKESEKFKLEEIASLFSALPCQIESRLLKLQNELCHAFTKEVEKVSSMKHPNENHQLPFIEPQHRESCSMVQSAKRQPSLMENSFVPLKVYKGSTRIPETKAEILKSLKSNPATLTARLEPKREEKSLIEKGRNRRSIIELDEEFDDFSFLLEKNAIDTGNHFLEEAKEETRRILRKARRRRRRVSWNPIILD